MEYLADTVALIRHLSGTGKIGKAAKEIKELELHDRLIVATGRYLKIPILTCDRLIQESNDIRTIWNEDS